MGFTVARCWAVMLAASMALVLPAAPPATAADTAGTSCASFDAIAHRGFRPAGVDENSAEAIERGAARGFSLELDVRTDADGTLWLFHDRNARRATGVDRLIEVMHTREVRALRYRKAGSRLLTLDEAMDVIAAHPATDVYLEPKSGPAGLATADVIVERQRTANTWVTARSREAHEAHPEVRLLQKVDEGTRPEASTLLAGGIDTVALAPRSLSREDVDYYRSAGLAVQARNVSGTMAWRRGIAAGVDGQLTDSPLELRRFCPYALSAPLVSRARSTRRSGLITTLVIRGTALYDASRVRLGRRLVPFTQPTGTKIVVRTTRKVLRGNRVSVVTPNGVARRLVTRG